MKIAETKVGKYKVQIKNPEYPSIVTFSSGEKGRREKGHYAFWTAVVRRGKKGRLWGRARLILSAGDRFDRMKYEMNNASDKEDRRIYRKHYVDFLGRGGNIKYIRPSTIKEICRWCDTHESDARYIINCNVGGYDYDLY